MVEEKWCQRVPGISTTKQLQVTTVQVVRTIGEESSLAKFRKFRQFQLHIFPGFCAFSAAAAFTKKAWARNSSSTYVVVRGKLGTRQCARNALE